MTPTNLFLKNCWMEAMCGFSLVNDFSRVLLLIHSIHSIAIPFGTFTVLSLDYCIPTGAKLGVLAARDKALEDQVIFMNNQRLLVKTIDFPLAIELMLGMIGDWGTLASGDKLSFLPHVPAHWVAHLLGCTVRCSDVFSS